jgi:NAD(P)-dependent dehydrogenase (short-subunit alcohol dehydrogenase family)
MELKDRVAVVAGGASGLGAATARRLAEQGMRVAVLDREEAKARQLALEIAGIAVQADVGDAESVQAAIQTVVSQCGGIHVGINCAGVAPAARLVGRKGPMPLADFERAIRINLIGTFNVMRCLAAQMTQQAPVTADGERGVIINTASIASEDGQVGQCAYSASKGGVVAMTLPAARELSQFGVRVMTISPGVMDTPMMADMPPEVQTGLAATIPFPKRFGNDHEYAILVQQIIENSYLNGSVIRLDGAIRMGTK